MKRFILFIFAISISTITVAATELIENDLAPMTSPDFDALFLASSFKIPKARFVYIEDVSVEFSHEWMQEYRTKTSLHYQEGIKKKYGATMKKKIIEQLENSGWSVADKKSAKTLVLVPKIQRLYIYAPNEPGIRQVIVRNAGYAQLTFSFAAPDGTVFMKIIDRRLTRDNVGSPIVANKASNYRYFKMLMENWAESSVKYLDSVKQIAEDQAQKN